MSAGNPKSQIALLLLVLVVATVLVAQNFFGGEKEANRLKITDAKAVAVKGTEGELMVSLKLTNSGDAVTVTGVNSAESKMAHFMGDGSTNFIVPGGGGISFEADGTHIMLKGVASPIEDGLLIPVTLVAGDGSTLGTKARVSMSETGKHSMHGSMAGMPISPAPDIILSLEKDSESGKWSVSANVTNFEFDKDRVDAEHVPGFGHGHLYLNGAKLGRYFGGSYEIGTLPSGNHEIKLSLNTNTHMLYVADGEKVAKKTIIDVK